MAIAGLDGMAESRLHYRTCSICEAMCGIVIEHRDGQVLSIKPDKQDAFRRHAAENQGVVFLMYLAKDDLTCVHMKE